jgi:hypothetical protein
MATMMEHPKHGRHSAVPFEVERMLENGWKVMPPKVKQQPVEAQPAEDQGASEEEEAQERTKRPYTRRNT